MMKGNNNNNNNNNSQYCISVKNLVKSYEISNLKRRNVIDDISFDIDYGTVFGFLGPNGAGKTTTIKILTGILEPTTGSIKILDKDIKKNNVKQIKRQIGVVTQNPSFESNLTVERSMELYGFLWGNSSNKNKDKVREMLDIFELTSIKEIRNEDLSIGQRRRVQIAREFLHEMDLLFLDEPTVGLDPRARRNLLNYIKKQVKHGLTVFFTTHIMEEVDYLCDKICIINKGKIIEFDTPQLLKQKYGSTKKIDIILQNPISKQIHEFFRKLSANSIDIENIENKENNTFSIISNNPQNVLLSTINFLFQNNIQIENIALNDPSIEDVFLKALKNNNK
jgi:ABC-2 type transport system ATP-binding protein